MLNFLSYIHVGLTWAHNPNIFKVGAVVIPWVHTKTVKDACLKTSTVHLIEEYGNIKDWEGVWTCGYCICGEWTILVSNTSQWQGFERASPLKS